MSESIKQAAQTYVSVTTKNVADLERVSVDCEMKDHVFTADGKEVTIKIIEVDGEKYRVPRSVIRDLKLLLEQKPALKFFKVLKRGTGMDTDYLVYPLE